VKSVLAVIALLVVSPQATLCMRAQAKDQTSKVPSINLPNVKRDYLLNGLQIIVIPQPGSGSVKFVLRINSGALFDLAGKGGMAYLTAGMLLRGGAGYTASNVREMAETLNLRIDATADWDSTDIAIAGPADSIESIFDLLSRLVVTPTFDPREFEALKSAHIAALKNQTQDDAEYVRQKACEMLFGSHPFGHPVHGTVESVSRIERNDLLYYHKRFYLANNAELLVTGDVTAEQVFHLARPKLGLWKKGELVPPTFRPPDQASARQVAAFDRPAARLAHAAIALMGFSRRASDYYAARVMSEVLTGTNAKLGPALGATIQTRVEPHMIASPLLIEIESPPDRIAAVIEATIQAINRIKAGQISLEQVNNAKQQLASSFNERVNSAEGLAGILLDIELYGLGRDYLLHYLQWLDAITLDEVTRAAQKYLPLQSAVIAVAAPAAQVEGALKKVGSVTVLK
jgi:zinc protease